MRIRWVFVLAVGSLAVAAFVGATTGRGATAAPSASSAAQSSNGTAATAAKKTVGIISFIEADESTHRMSAAIKKVAESKGWSVQLVDTNVDLTKAVAAFNRFITDKVSGIFTVTTDNSALKVSIKKAADAGIPVISVAGGQWVPGLTLDVGLPDLAATALASQYFFDTIRKRYGDQKVTVYFGAYPEGNPCRAREIGFDAAAKLYPNVAVKKYHVNVQNALSATKDFMATRLRTEGKSTVGFLGCWGVPAMGAALAAKQVGRTKDFIAVGISGNVAEVDLLRKHDPNFVATVMEGVAIAGYDAGQWMDKVFKKTAQIPASGRIYAPVTLATNQGKPPYDVQLPAGWNPNYWK